MIIVRPAQAGDFPAIDGVLDAMELGHPSMRMSDFWVAEVDGDLAGVVNVADCGASLYVSAVGVLPEYRGQGVAAELLSECLRHATKGMYVYTKIPEFFRRFRFDEAAPPPEIPPREIYGCATCEEAERCVCMMRPPDGAALS